MFFTYTDYNWDEGVSLCWIEEKLDADVQIHQQNFLRIGNPALYLKGHLNKGTLGFDKSQTAEEFRPRLDISTFELSKVEFWPDAMLETVSITDDNGIVHHVLQLTTEEPKSFVVEVFCLWCIYCSSKALDDGHGFGIVLSKTGQDTFSRIGMVKASSLTDEPFRTAPSTTIMVV